MHNRCAIFFLRTERTINLIRNVPSIRLDCCYVPSGAKHSTAVVHFITKNNTATVSLEAVSERNGKAASRGMAMMCGVVMAM